MSGIGFKSFGGWKHPLDKGSGHGSSHSVPQCFAALDWQFNRSLLPALTKKTPSWSVANNRHAACRAHNEWSNDLVSFRVGSLWPSNQKTWKCWCNPIVTLFLLNLEIWLAKATVPVSVIYFKLQVPSLVDSRGLEAAPLCPDNTEEQNDEWIDVSTEDGELSTVKRNTLKWRTFGNS